MIIFPHTLAIMSFTYHFYHLTPTPKTVIRYVSIYKILGAAWGFYRWLVLLFYPKGHGAGKGGRVVY